MRSRDGNHSFSLTIPVTLFFFSSLVLSASEYLISYRYVVHNAILYNESLDISQSMKKCSGSKSESLVLESSTDEPLKTTLKNNREEFVDFIHTIGLSVAHKEKHTAYSSETTTILTLRTRCFKVDFNDTFVTISALK